MAWVAPAIMAASAAVGAMSQASSGGKSGGQAYYTAQMMPEEIRSKLEAGMRGMPGSINIGFGGNTYPVTYGPLKRTAQTMYQPSGVIPNDYSPNALTGAMTASAPYMWQWAMNPAGQQQPAANSAYLAPTSNVSMYGYPYYTTGSTGGMM